MKSTLTIVALALSALCLPSMARADEQEKLIERIKDGEKVLRQLVQSPDDAIPQYILDRAEAIIVIPSLVKGGFIVGAQHGRGMMSVRDRSTRTWSPPSFVVLTGGSFGLQIGAQSVELVLLVMNRDGVEELVKDQFKFGAGLSVAAGPVGRSAEAGTDVKLSAEILAYSRAKGLFAGATLEGASLRADMDANRDFYGKRLTTRQIALENAVTNPPPAAEEWRRTLSTLTANRPRT
jgi:SH3 domain-containing YSC84-like protein 1